MLSNLCLIPLCLSLNHNCVPSATSAIRSALAKIPDPRTYAKALMLKHFYSFLNDKLSVFTSKIVFPFSLSFILLGSFSECRIIGCQRSRAPALDMTLSPLLPLLLKRSQLQIMLSQQPPFLDCL